MKHAPLWFVAAAATLFGVTWLYLSSSGNFEYKPETGQPWAISPATASSAVVSTEAADKRIFQRSLSASSAASSDVLARPQYEYLADALPRVQMALSGSSSPGDTLQAAHDLEQCVIFSEGAENLIAIRDKARELPPTAQKVFDATGGASDENIAFAKDAQRRCQVFDAATLARRSELYKRALEGGAPGAAVAYLRSLQNSIRSSGEADLKLIQKLQASVRKDADSGDPDSMLAYITSNEVSGRGMGSTPTEKQAYKSAWLVIQDERMPGSGAVTIKMLESMAQMSPPTVPLTAAEQQEAAALAQKLVSAWRRGLSGG